MVLFGFSLLPAGKPGRDEIENTTPTITIIPIITDIVATNLTEGISSLHSRSEEHTSELQSQSNLVCRLLLEKKKTRNYQYDLLLYFRSTTRLFTLMLLNIATQSSTVFNTSLINYVLVAMHGTCVDTAVCRSV